MGEINPSGRKGRNDFRACPNCCTESGGLTDVIKHLEALIAK
ncbi:hypothetical protein PO124_24175 [Bacillus licheniformis]|nr:hypothetical protein [Bacillus licheniformis]